MAVRDCRILGLAFVFLISAAGFGLAQSTETAPSSAPPYLADGPGTEKAERAASLRAAAAEKGTIDIVVGLAAPIGAAETVGKAEHAAQKEAFREATTGLAERVFGSVPRKRYFKPFTEIPFATMTVDAAELDRVLSDPAVTSVEEDAPVTITPRLKEMVDITNANYLWTSKRANKGKGRTLAIIDVGFDPSLPSFKNRVVHEACHARRGRRDGCVADKSAKKRKKKATGKWASWGCRKSPKSYTQKSRRKGKPKFCTVHGTIVASVAAGQKTKVRKLGVFDNGIAPKLNLVLVRVPFADSNHSSIAKNIEYVLKKRKKFDIEAVTMSLGLQRSTSECSEYLPVVTAAIEALVEAGLPFFNSAGNDNSNSSIDYPGCLESVVSVGASEEKDKAIADFSDTNHLVELLSPGDKVTVVKKAKGEPWDTSGSSFAAPSVAAGYTLLKAATKKATTDEIVTAMRCTGKPLTRSGVDVAIPRMDLKQAYKFLKNPTMEQVWDFSTKDGSLAWHGLLGGWTVEGGNAVLHEADDYEFDLFMTDLCFEDFDLRARMKYAYTTEEDNAYYFPRGIVLLEESKYDSFDRPEDRLLNGLMFQFSDIRQFSSGDNILVRQLVDVPVNNYPTGGSKPSLCVASDNSFTMYAYNDIRVIANNGTVRFYVNGTLYCEVAADTSKLKTVALYAYLPDPANWSTYVGPRYLKTDYVKIKGLK